MTVEQRWQVRRATIEDSSSLAQLNQHVHALHVEAEPGDFHDVDPADTQDFFASLFAADEHVAFVAVDAAGQAIGYVLAQDHRRPVTPFTRATRTFYIHHVSVAPDGRRQGVGNSLMSAVETEARQRGISRLALDHWAFNETAQRFFAGLGFRPYNTRMRRELSNDDADLGGRQRQG